MKAILAVTMLALLVLAGFLIFQFLPQNEAEPVQVAAPQPAPEPAPAESDNLFAPASVESAPQQAVSTPEPATEPAAEEAGEQAVVEAEAPAEEAQIDESLLPQPNNYDMASITAAGREIATMNQVEVMSALNNGADQMMALREQIQQAEELGSSDEVARLQGQHDALEKELLSLANRGVSLNKPAE